MDCDTEIASYIHKAVVQVVSMHDPPRIAQCLFDSRDLRVTSLLAFLVAYVKFLKADKIPSNSFVDAIAYQQS